MKTSLPDLKLTKTPTISVPKNLSDLNFYRSPPLLGRFSFFLMFWTVLIVYFRLHTSFWKIYVWGRDYDIVYTVSGIILTQWYLPIWVKFPRKNPYFGLYCQRKNTGWGWRRGVTPSPNIIFHKKRCANALYPKVLSQGFSKHPKLLKSDQ